MRRSNHARLHGPVAGVACFVAASLAAPFMACTGTDAERDVGAMRASPVLKTEGASRIASHAITLAPGAGLVLRLQDLSSLRTAAHLWDVRTQRELSRGHRITYVNRGAEPRELRLLVIGRGTGVLLLHDTPERLDLAIRRHPVPGGRDYRYITAPGPGPAPEAVDLLGFDATGRLIAYAHGTGSDDDPWPSVVAEGVREVVVATPGANATSQVRLYANDPEDGDGDGLGAELERALGTCDALEQPGCGSGPLGDYYRAVPYATRDSDRDGLPDADELLGAPALPGRPGLALPQWGADPRHKDVFVEVDYAGKLGHVGLSERDLERVAALYAVGSAGALRNPDGRDGVRLHFDVGFEPRHRRNVGLFGDWGGSNRSSTGKYKLARRRHMTPGRGGYFRYALAARRGTGQAHGDALTFNHHYHRVSVLAHELAHTMGLRHFGHARWGRANCKPHYVSIMNYIYQNEAEVGFSRAPAPWLDPAAVIERSSLGDLDADRLRAPPLELDVDGSDVDWNRDGLISDEPVRAPLTWATFKSCGEPAKARTPVYRGSFAPSRPALVRVERDLLALWVDGRGRVLIAHAPVTGQPDGHGSCPQGDADSSVCGRFARVRAIPGLAGVHHLSARASTGRLWLAYAGTDRRLELAELDVSSGESAVRVLRSITISEAVSDDVPDLLVQPIEPAEQGGDRTLLLLFRGADGRLWEARSPLDLSDVQVAPARDAGGAPIELGLGPTGLVLGTGETCGVFPDRSRHLRFFCQALGAPFDAPSDPRGRSGSSWRDLSQQAFYEGLGPHTEGPAALAYHRYRTASGRPIDPGGARGAVYLAFSSDEDDTEPAAAWWFVSEWLSREDGASTGIRFRWRGRVIDQWTSLPTGAGIALHEDAQLSALKALVPIRPVRAERTRLEFLPLADGAYHAELTAGDDFAVMERGICTGIRSEIDCGGPDTAAAP